jgi:hypothetical protein
VSELLKAGKPVIAARCYQTIPRSTLLRETCRRHRGDGAVVGDELSGRQACSVSGKPRRKRRALCGERAG